MSNELKKLDTLDNLELTSFEQIFDIADRLSKSTGFLPKIFEGKPGTILACILKSRELGFSMMAGFSALYVVPTKGGDHKIGIYADAMSALLQIRGYKEKWITTTDKEAKIELIAPDGESNQYTFTIADAKTAGLAGKDNWIKYPRSMLQARVRAAAARLFAPKVMHGLYTQDELEELAPPEKVVLVQTDNTSGKQTLLTALKAKHQETHKVNVIHEETNEVKGTLQVEAQTIDAFDEEGVPSDSFTMLNDMLDEAKTAADLDLAVEKIKSSFVSDDERERLGAKYLEVKKTIVGG